MLRRKKSEEKFTFGYQKNFARNLLTAFAKFFIFVFRLNSNSLLSNEIMQNIHLTRSVEFDGKELIFKTGHNRLNWRVATFYSEEPLMISWLKTFDDADVFLDVGSNVGIYSLAAASKGAKVFCIELDPINISILFSNIYYNKFFEKVVILPFAVGSEKKIDNIFYRDFSVGDALQSVGREQVLPTNTRSPFSIAQVVVPLDMLFKEYNLPQPTRVKIDVDGNEKIVFEGGRNVILNAQEIYFEDNGLEEDTSIIDEILNAGFVKVDETRSDVGDLKNPYGMNMLFRKQSSDRADSQP